MRFGRYRIEEPPSKNEADLVDSVKAHLERKAHKVAKTDYDDSGFPGEDLNGFDVQVLTTIGRVNVGADKSSIAEAFKMIAEYEESDLWPQESNTREYNFVIDTLRYRITVNVEWLS